MPRLVDTSVEDTRLDVEENDVAALFHFLDTLDVPWSIAPGDLAVAFIDPETCSELHTRFFSDPSVTDVMTFPGEEEDDHAGDLAVCPEYAVERAEEFGQNFATELTLYLVHGWLHLAGLDDRADDTRAAMRNAEADLMRRLQAAGKVLPARWNP